MIRLILIATILPLLSACGDSSGDSGPAEGTGATQSGDTTQPGDTAELSEAELLAILLADCEEDCTSICMDNEGRTACLDECSWWEEDMPGECTAEFVALHAACTATTPEACDCAAGFPGETTDCPGYDSGLADSGCRSSLTAWAECSIAIGQAPEDALLNMGLILCDGACESGEDFAACYDSWTYGASDDRSEFPCQAEELAMFDACLRGTDLGTCVGGTFAWDASALSQEGDCAEAQAALATCESR